jgi:hypothetical protein
MYTIYFEDGQVWQGGSIENSNWNDMPNKLIKRIDYSILDKHFSMEGFEAYNHIVERVQFVLNANKPKISKVILMGLTNGEVYKLIFNLNTMQITEEISYYGKEYYNKATTGWKSGLKMVYPTTNII